MKKLSLMLAMILLTTPAMQGCSVMKWVSQPFKNTVSKVPEKTEKSFRKIKCKGAIELDSSGRVVKCNDDYFSYERNFVQEERKLTLREKISQFILNAKGYVIWAVIICFILSASGFGWVVRAAWDMLRGTGRFARDVFKGISEGKKYVRANGANYSPAEREAYRKGAQDLMDRVGYRVNSNKQSRKVLGKLKAKVEE